MEYQPSRGPQRFAPVSSPVTLHDIGTVHLQFAFARQADLDIVEWPTDAAARRHARLAARDRQRALMVP